MEELQQFLFTEIKIYQKDWSEKLYEKI